MKAETRVIGIDDGTTRLRRRVVVGVVFRGSLWLDGVVAKVIDVTAASAGRRLARMVTESKFCNELRVAMLHGAMLSSMKATGLMEFSVATRLPTIAILQGRQIQIVGQILRRARKATHCRLQKDMSALGIGLTAEKAVEILRLTSRRDVMPEPLRVAGLIASAVNTPKRLNWTLRHFGGWQLKPKCNSALSAEQRSHPR